MAYTSITSSSQVRRYLGMSLDTKPSGSTVLKGSQLTEADTGKEFVYDGHNWMPVDTESSDACAPLIRAQLDLQVETNELLRNLLEVLSGMA